ARYQLPSAKNMDEKGWMGSDLLFDIDADHLCNLRRVKFCPVCGNLVEGDRCERDNVEALEYVEMTNECISRGLEEARRLVNVLENDFSFKPKVYFSGNRGFHVHVECYDDCALLDSANSDNNFNSSSLISLSTNILDFFISRIYFLNSSSLISVMSS
ncbi:hypothetical protein DJ521_07500, partial [Sulfolobus sp. E3]